MKKSNNDVKETASKNDKGQLFNFKYIILILEFKKYILRPKKLSAHNKKPSELNIKINIQNQNQVKLILIFRIDLRQNKTPIINIMD